MLFRITKTPALPVKYVIRIFVSDEVTLQLVVEMLALWFLLVASFSTTSISVPSIGFYEKTTQRRLVCLSYLYKKGHKMVRVSWLTPFSD
jgi:hypothetical protein